MHIWFSSFPYEYSDTISGHQILILLLINILQYGLLFDLIYYTKYQNVTFFHVPDLLCKIDLIWPRV
jgi:hypothetical protein